MWQSKTIKHWLGSTSQDVTVNRKSELRGSISCGVSKTLWGPKQLSVLRVAKQQTGTWWSAWPEPGWGHTAPWATLRASRQQTELSRVTLCSERRALDTTTSSCCSHVQVVLGQSKSTHSSRGRRRKSNGIFELQLSPIRSRLIKQKMLPGCQSCSLAFQSVLEELLVQDGPYQSWVIPLYQRRTWNAEEKLLMACKEGGCFGQDALRSLAS